MLSQIKSIWAEIPSAPADLLEFKFRTRFNISSSRSKIVSNRLSVELINIGNELPLRIGLH